MSVVEPIYIKSQSPAFRNTQSSYSPSQSDFCSTSNNHKIERNGYATDSELSHYHINGRNLESRSLLTTNGFRFHNTSQLIRNQSIDGSKGEMGNSLQNNEDFDSMTPPLRLQSIQMLINRLNAEENNKNNIEMHNLYNTQLNGSTGREFKGIWFNFLKIILDGVNCYSDLNTSVRQNSFAPQNMPEPPPASADSGHPYSSGSNYDIRESPSLFSDAFKLDLSN